MTMNIILNKFKNTFPFETKTKNKNLNQIYFQNSNLLKMKTIFKK